MSSETALVVVLVAIAAGFAGGFLGRQLTKRSVQEASVRDAARLSELKEEIDQRNRDLEDLRGNLTIAERAASSSGAHLLEQHESARKDAERILELKTALDKREKELEDLRKTLGVSEQAVSALETRLEEQAKNAEEKLKLLDTAEQKLKDAFAALASSALAKNSEQFLGLAGQKFTGLRESAKEDLEQKQQAVDALVKPVTETLAKIQDRLEEVERNRTGTESGLTSLVHQISVSQEMLRSETQNLVKALRTPNVRGRWGEMQLRRVVEIAGMLSYCDFQEQVSTDSDSGKLRPDVVINLAGGKSIVVDSKAPLAAYLDALEEKDDAARDVKLRDHARQVRDHITKLSSKAYWDQFKQSPDFVVMFLPGETFFSVALQYDPSLIEYGVEQRVVPASPTTLIALLRAAAYGWKQETIAENAHQISDLGKELYDRLSKLGEHFGRIGGKLHDAVEAYNDALGSLEGRVFVSARRFRELGAVTSDGVKELKPVDVLVRPIQAAELRALASSSNDAAE